MKINLSMKRSILILMLCGWTITAFSQREAEALQGNHGLPERYLILKGNAQAYKDYRVIKESVLDGFWRIVKDTLASREKVLAARQDRINQLEAQLARTDSTLRQKEASMANIVHDSAHIEVLGIDLAKQVFLTTVMVILAVLLLVVAFASWRMKSANQALHARQDAFDSLSAEFEDYKRKAMDKQTKLSRELQNERNRLQEMRGMGNI